MLFAVAKLVFRITRRMGMRPWSLEGRALLRLILAEAKKLPDQSGDRQSAEEKTLQAMRRLAESKKARERIAQALGVSSVDAWMFQESLKRALGEMNI
jgi:hypothetical protein